MALQVGRPILVLFRQRLFAQRILSVLFVKPTVEATGTDDLVEEQLLANFMADPTSTGGPMATWRNQLTTAMLFDEVRVQALVPRLTYRVTPIGLAGTHSGTTNTANLAASITKQTDLPGRHGVGRLQLAGLPQTAWTAGELAGGVGDSLRSDFSFLTQEFTEPTGGGSYRWCLFNTITSPSTPRISNIVIQQEARTMHRRTVRLGE